MLLLLAILLIHHHLYHLVDSEEVHIQIASERDIGIGHCAIKTDDDRVQDIAGQKHVHRFIAALFLVLLLLSFKAVETVKEDKAYLRLNHVIFVDDLARSDVV